jgi:Domain of unknown function (DUF4440)
MAGRASIAVAVCMAWAGRTAAQVPPKDSAYLVATTQALLDAVTAGDSTVWAPNLAPEWFLTDEEGQHTTREAFLARLRPLPPGQQGRLQLTRWHLTGGSDVAVMSYDASEEHDFYGQRLTTRFHVTDMYVRRNGRWLQLASQVTALPTPISGKALDLRRAREYSGAYELTPEIRLTVTAGDSGLGLESAGRPPQRLFALDDRIFIRHGLRGFWVFERDSTGMVAALVNWRDNNAVVWRRVRPP